MLSLVLAAGKVANDNSPHVLQGQNIAQEPAKAASAIV